MRWHAPEGSTQGSLPAWLHPLSPRIKALALPAWGSPWVGVWSSQSAPAPLLDCRRLEKARELRTGNQHLY